jgi:hypothetical protein
VDATAGAFRCPFTTTSRNLDCGRNGPSARPFCQEPDRASLHGKSEDYRTKARECLLEAETAPANLRLKPITIAQLVIAVASLLNEPPI